MYMYMENSEKKRMTIREKAEEELKQYLDQPVLHIDENALE